MKRRHRARDKASVALTMAECARWRGYGVKRRDGDADISQGSENFEHVALEVNTAGNDRDQPLAENRESSRFVKGARFVGFGETVDPCPE